MRRGCLYSVLHRAPSGLPNKARSLFLFYSSRPSLLVNIPLLSGELAFKEGWLLGLQQLWRPTIFAQKQI